jgi:hypothetical protein
MAHRDTGVSMQSIFHRETAKRDIIRDRKIINVYKFADIVSAHANRKADEVVIIHPGFEIIPGEQGAPSPYYSARNFLKRGPLVQIPTFTEMEMMAQEWSDLKARIKASENPENKREVHYSGWMWYEPGTKIAHVLNPATVMEGHRLFITSQQSKQLKDKIKLPDKIYRARDSHLITISAVVPARHDADEEHQVNLEHVTTHTDPRRFVEWTKLRSRHECALKRSDFSFRFSDYVTYCPHDVAAYDAYSARVAKEHKVVIPQPFPLTSEPLMRLYLSLLNDTMQIVIDRSGPREKQRFRPLSLAQTNPILMDAWLNPDYTNRMTFYLHKPVGGYKRMSEFDITPSAAGMPFRDPPGYKKK